MLKRQKTEQAKGELRRQLEELPASEWGELAGVKMAWVYGGTWFEHDGQWRPGPWKVEAVAAALARGNAAGNPLSEERSAEVLLFYELTTFARVTRTEEELRHLTEHLPGPELERSGVVGRLGLERWAPPRLESNTLTFYANAPTTRGADFVCVQIDVLQWAIAVEIVDTGWFEVEREPVAP